MTKFGFLFLFCTLSLQADVKPPYIHKSVEINECASELTSVPTTQTKELECINANSKFLFGAEGQVIINSVTYGKSADNAKETICKKISSSKKYEIEVKDKTKIKSLVYTVEGVGKALVFGDDDTKCFEGLDLADSVLMSGFVQVKSINCIPETKVVDHVALKAKTSDKKIYFDKSKACFLAPLLTTPLTLEVKVGEKNYNLTASAYPDQSCPACSTSTDAATNQGKSTANTTTIIVVVVVVVGIVLAGIGFVFLRK